MKILKDERGSVLEFVLTIPIVLAIILIGITLIMLSYSKIASNISAREAARTYAVMAYEADEATRVDQAKTVAVESFQGILPLKNVYINKDNVELGSPMPGYVSGTVTAYVPLMAPGMGKILNKDSTLFDNSGTVQSEGRDVRVLTVKGYAVFKEEININN